MSRIFELCRRSPLGVFAVPYRGGRPQKAVRLPDGAIVEDPSPEQRLQAPDRVDESFRVGHGGVPATSHHLGLGLVIGFLPLAGFYLLPDGSLSAIYGAEPVCLDASTIPAS